jgi:hypothetical protein
MTPFPNNIEIFHHTLSDGQPAKFSIWRTEVNSRTYYSAKVVGEDLDSYIAKTDAEKSVTFGVDVRGEDRRIVYYSDPLQLKADIIAKYGDVYLISEV